jgi:hypothetical protein
MATSLTDTCQEFCLEGVTIEPERVKLKNLYSYSSCHETADEEGLADAVMIIKMCKSAIAP